AAAQEDRAGPGQTAAPGDRAGAGLQARGVEAPGRMRVRGGCTYAAARGAIDDPAGRGVSSSMPGQASLRGLRRGVYALPVSPWRFRPMFPRLPPMSRFRPPCAPPEPLEPCDPVVMF